MNSCSVKGCENEGVYWVWGWFCIDHCPGDPMRQSEYTMIGTTAERWDKRLRKWVFSHWLFFNSDHEYKER